MATIALDLKAPALGDGWILARTRPAPVGRTDADLVTRCARGDETALGELYERYGRAAYGLAQRVLRDPALAEDAVQEAFLAAWRGASRFDPGRARVASWLLTHVHHKAVDIVRREASRPPRSHAGELPERGDGGDLAAEVIGRADRSVVRAALASLRREHREVLELAYFGGLSQSEVADHLGEPLGTVKSRTHAALARLRDLLVELR